jgi:transposase
MKIQHIIGADLSKKTIDLFIHESNLHLLIENTTSGFKQMIKWFRQNKLDLSLAMIVMEHTGLYSYVFEDFLHHNQIAFSKVNPMDIKLSIGMVRGKSDKVDAARIARYGYEKKEILSPQPQVDQSLKRLKMLLSVRKGLVKQRAALLCAVKEYRNIGLDEKDLIIASQMKIIRQITNQIDQLKHEMISIVEKQNQLNQNYQLLQSIKGVGAILALTTIIKTGNFERFTNARKFACYCGTAPFEHSSGISIKRRTRVSHLADKEMKTLLDLSAKSAIQFDLELKAFYQKRIETGKSKLSTINVVRNKIIYRMFAVIKRQTGFILKAA